MRTKRKIRIRRTALFLIFAFLIACFPAGVFAESTVEADRTYEEQQQDASLPESGKIPVEQPDEPHEITEIVARREENVKHFDLGYGNFQAVSYANAVHRKDANGQWQDIDNRLFESNSVSDRAYSTLDGRVTANADTPSISVHEDGYSIEMSPVVGMFYTASVTEIKNHPLPVQSRKSAVSSIEEIAAVDNTSSILYSGVYNSTTDIEYVLEANDIKENIIVRGPTNNCTYVFTVRLTNLYPELQSDGKILLLNTTTDEPVYVIPAPYMYDANGNISYAVQYTLTEAGENQYTIAVIADSNWISSDERAFPVVIDPTIEDNVVYDTYIDSASPATNYGISSELWISSNRTTFIKINSMPDLEGLGTFTSAKLYVSYYYHNTVTAGSLTAGVYQVLYPWYEEALTWNIANQKPNLGISSTLLSTASFSGSAGAYITSPKWRSFDITSAAASWYNGSSPNYGIALKRYSGTNASVILNSYEAGYSYRAYFVITYREPSIASGVYKIKNAQNGLYVDVDAGGATSGTRIQQWSAAASGDELNQLFKITYLGTYGTDYQLNYYSIRSMNNSILGVETPLSGANRNATLEEISCNDTWADLLYNHLWAISKNGSFYTIKNGAISDDSYLTAPSNSTNGQQLFTAETQSAASNWILEPYTGERLDHLVMTSMTTSINRGESFQYQAYMYDTVIGANGPVQYSVTNIDGTATDKATMNSYTGKLQALKPGQVHVNATYSGARWSWWWTITIDGAEDGTYFFQNREDATYLQIAQSDAPNYSTDQAGMEARKFTGGEYQRWKITLASGKYYKIESVKSGKVVAVASGKENQGDQSLVQEAYTGNARQLWSIEKQSSGTYIIRPKSGEAYTTDWCMANGSYWNDYKVQQRECKTGNSSYKEEWVLYNVNTYIRKTYPAICYYDNMCTDYYTPEELESLYLDAVAIFTNTFSIKFDLSQFSYAEALNFDPNACDTAWYEPCSSVCGSVANCGTLHHKGASRLNDLLKSDTHYVCRIVGYKICFWENGSHTMKNGVGDVDNKNIIISTTSINPDVVIGTIQHEILHNLGISDHDHCTPGQPCVTFSTSNVNQICDHCKELIRNKLWG